MKSLISFQKCIGHVSVLHKTLYREPVLFYIYCTLKVVENEGFLIINLYKFTLNTMLNSAKSKTFTSVLITWCQINANGFVLDNSCLQINSTVKQLCRKFTIGSQLTVEQKVNYFICTISALIKNTGSAKYSLTKN